jgi:Vam6/Vps39-like protein vacuolar protein sorting-associated protein 39
LLHSLTPHIQDQRRTRIRALNAVAQFRAAEFDAAIDTFIELDFNPTKVVALYPESVAGRLSVPQEGWIPLYGGPSPVEEDHSSSEASQENDKARSSQEKPTIDPPNSLTSGTGSIGGRLRKSGLGMFIASVNKDKDDDSASVNARRKPLHGMFFSFSTR